MQMGDILNTLCNLQLQNIAAIINDILLSATVEEFWKSVNLIAKVTGTITQLLFLTHSVHI